MITALQTPDIVNVVDRFGPTDQSVELGSVDPTIANLVIPIDPTFVAARQVVTLFGGTSINGVSVDFDDVLGIVIPAGETTTARDTRFYSGVRIQAAGGTVNPVTIRMAYMYGGVEIDFNEFTVANPGVETIGPFLVMPGIALRVFNQINGGAGDTLSVRFNGFIARPGVGVPMVPAPAVTV